MSAVGDLGAVSLLLSWDRQTYLPEGGIPARAEQLATVSRLAHEMLVSSETGELLESLRDADPETEDGALVRVARRDYDQAAKLPARLVEEISRTGSLAEPVWVKARAGSDWRLFAPHLEKAVALQREATEHLGYEDHPYDALLDIYEPGAKKSRLETTFAELKDGLVPLIKEIKPDETCETPLRGDFDERKQQEFGAAVISDFGYDWSRGRQDRAVHPFCAGMNPGDVRITTRFDPAWLSPALFATFHEAGHALYEQGISSSYTRSPLGKAVSLGVHESQSRLWENLVGRSHAFWNHFYPKLQEIFREQLGSIGLETFYRAINAARPSEIRVEADELTYNLHILIRFELEVALIEGSLPVAELPAAWNTKMEEYLGLIPETNSSGVLQDVHWAAGLFGYFPTYTIGNVLSVQLFDAALKQYPEIPSEIEQGKFASLLDWLRQNIHLHGSRYEPDDLIERATGRPLDTAPYLDYLRNKFGELYGFG